MNFNSYSFLSTVHLRKSCFRLLLHATLLANSQERPLNHAGSQQSWSYQMDSWVLGSPFPFSSGGRELWSTPLYCTRRCLGFQTSAEVLSSQEGESSVQLKGVRGKDEIITCLMEFETSDTKRGTRLNYYPLASVLFTQEQIPMAFP